MAESYIECLVKKQAPLWGRPALWSLYALGGIFLGLGLINPIGLPVALLCFGLTFFVRGASEVEFEYLYLDKELEVDKIVAKSRRKRQAVYPLAKVEMLAPASSPRLAGLHQRGVRVRDFSAGEAGAPVYGMWVRDGEAGECLALLSLSPALVERLRLDVPRKVYLD